MISRGCEREHGKHIFMADFGKMHVEKKLGASIQVQGMEIISLNLVNSGHWYLQILKGCRQQCNKISFPPRNGLSLRVTKRMLTNINSSNICFGFGPSCSESGCKHGKHTRDAK